MSSDRAAGAFDVPERVVRPRRVGRRRARVVERRFRREKVFEGERKNLGDFRRIQFGLIIRRRGRIRLSEAAGGDGRGTPDARWESCP